jgi:predicted dehydrogenase
MKTAGMARKLRLGVVGTGVASRLLYLPALERVSNKVEITACTNRTRRKAESFAKQTGARVVDTPEQLIALPEVDAVFLSLPISTQPEYVRKALAAGKPLMSEKPIAPTLAEAEELVELAKRASVPWLIGENYAFMPALARAARWIEAERLGEVRIVEARQVTLMNQDNPYFATSWRATPTHPGGFVLDGGVHLAHALRRLAGVPEVLARTTHQFDPALPPFDTAAALLKFPSGARGTWTSCFATRGGGPMLRLLGTRGVLELGWDNVRLVPARGKEAVFRTDADSFALQFRHFADVVLKGTELAYTPADALLDLQVISSIFGS